METRLRGRLERAPLLAVLNRVIEATASKSKLPSLGCFLLSLDRTDRMLVQATDLEVSIEDTCPVIEAESFGRVMVPAGAFRDIVKRLPEDEIEILELDNYRLEIRAGESLSRLAGYDPAPFPEIPVSSGEALEVWASDLQAIASAVGHAICKDETKVNLLGLHLQWTESATGDGVLVGTATDGHRLALAGKRLEAPAPIFAAGVLVPRKGIEAIKKLEGELALSLTGSALHVSRGELRLVIRLPEGIFPDPRRVIPEDLPGVFTVDGELLEEAVDRVRLLASENTVNLELDGETLLLKAESERGDSLDSVPAASETGPLSTRLDARYLLDALGSLGGGEIVVKYKDEGAPILLLPGDLSGFDERVLVIMPRRL